jgi:hypothetical protein
MMAILYSKAQKMGTGDWVWRDSILGLQVSLENFSDRGRVLYSRAAHRQPKKVPTPARFARHASRS